MSTTTSSPAAGAAAASAAGGAPRICFNTLCKEPISDPPVPRRRGWRLRSGDYADLCERCFYAYEQGSFCDTFHADATGWRNCETCGKRLHCGCIVSATNYYFLDAGGVDCVPCARKALGMVPNQMLSSSMPMQQGHERRDFTTKSWRPTAGPFPGQWRQGSHIWNLTSTQTDLQQRLSYEFDRPSAVERLIPGGRLSIVGHEKKFEEPPERIISTSLNNVSRDKYTNGSTGSEPVSTFNTYRREEANTDVQESCHLVAENDPNSTRKAGVIDPSTSSSSVKLETNPSPIVNLQSPTTLKEDPPSVLIGLAASLSPANGSKDTARFSSSQTPRQISPQLSKQFYSQGVIDGESQSQLRNGRPRMDTRTRTQLLPRYWPRITDQELQQISGDSNSPITPLFEKVLSASDAGRIGRLVLPKKCAEAYFPTISQPEGLPLKVQDATGKEWVFQFRFWPNNNSRMYVLEGVTPCIQSMQLQAGDTVTFSRQDPEGKLIMGFRKASSVSSEQEPQTPKAANGSSTPPEGNSRSTMIDLTTNIPLRAPKSSLETVNPFSPTEEPTSSKDAKTGFIQKDGPAAKSLPVPGKRKASTLGSKNKRLRIESEDSMELKLTWEEAQELLRPPNNPPNVVIIDGHEVEEYEEAPVLGRRTYFTKNQAGENFQWVQCDICSKWRKLPVDFLLPFRWTCSDNKWDPDYKRSSCSSAQELSLEQILDLVPTKTGASKRSKVKAETTNIEASGGLDTLANIALGEGENQPSTSQQTTKHPRHRPGCSCIVCIQPPSGKGPKHKQTCTCNVCLTVKRRFRTLMLRREKRQSEKEAENARKQQQQVKQSATSLPHGEGSPSSPGVGTNGSPQKAAMTKDGFLDEGSEHRRTSPSPLKAPQIDLNIQPEREEESSPRSDVGNLMRQLRDATA